jgi:hypothetical protein
MEKTSKIKSSKFTREWGEGQSKTFFHDIELENGDSGSIGAKEKNSDKLRPGSDLTYTIESGQYGNKIKAVSAGGGGGFGGGRKGPEPKTQIIGFAMSYTKDLIVADKAKLEQLPALFEKIYNLMASKL